ncbi:MAG TPA: NAD-dependent epimerase/dehydratase family protein [Candidatus Syntrophosphaera thermopropionivorans]|jgi:nucleoside-diphosphate-sugar epimerase|uniref:NAD-dependent epimerase/dehydratase family protein n=1 Tax=Candidatus Syntrophosphaera thermopropionivorans TaxID=2593015 RepID=A0AC61QK95_9BACT|nr:NAD-dependent epimerase/dehydratase family protein [Candidatus Syntrophosphaera thermopropionivorans]NLA44265.1 NAD-dependent epimerase/dehydratase family protein [Candidatus Cloacimonadota bacterium]HRQ99492.1 NAD-dependent epimerase/dehydratase family protein [Candidatus Syntrophosphaera sp.]TDF73884.1 NAD-dependent epimerase/dehydratase family protein [Candidatus Syntrophosphaera thermopropionivorans]HNU97302.1 NAD-dependent epimerase/dehydratase family protein [Candidatus Syntrophosphaer
MKNILVLGSAGQIGSELVPYLRNIYGNNNVVATYHRQPLIPEIKDGGPCENLDALEPDKVMNAVKKYNIDTIINLVAVLSAVGESKPTLAWKINMDSMLNVLEIAKEAHCAVFIPSSIGAFGPTTPHDNTPQDTIMRPTTIYGISKVAAELLGDYYFLKYGVDARGLRYPGIISNVTLPGGGTTDYAVEIYYEAIKNKSYVCYLKPGTFLDMMYMPDALRALVDLMEADPSRLKHRNCFNVTAMSFDPEMIAAEIKKHIPEFHMEYQIDSVKQAIADSWPNKMDDSAAREEWGWKPEYDLASMTEDMLRVLSTKLS